MAKPEDLPRRAFLALAFLGGGFGLGAGAAFVTRMAMRYRGEFLPGTKIGGVNISGLTPYQAVELFDSRWRSYIASPVVFRAPDRDWQPSSEEIGIGVDYITAIRQAYAWGRKGGIFRRGRENVAAVALSRDFPIQFTFDSGKLRRYLNGIASVYYRTVTDAAVELLDGEIRLTQDSPGLEMDWEAAVQLVVPPGPQAGPQFITIPVTITQPKLSLADVQRVNATIATMLEGPIILDFESRGWLITQATLRDALTLKRDRDELTINLEASAFQGLFDEIDNRLAIISRDGMAEYSRGSSRVLNFVAPLDGRRLDRDSLLKRVLNGAKLGNRKVDIPIIGVPAQRTPLKKLGIEDLIGVGESFFLQSPSFRIHNIEAGAALLHGALVGPGEEFSFNEVLGPIEYDRGFVDGLVIIENSTVDAIGGGICQVATTLFRAAFLAGLPIRERHKHLYRVRYYEQGGFPIGFDASIWQPELDLRFVNDTSESIMIRTIFNRRHRSLKFELWGRNPRRSVEISEHSLSDWSDPPPDEWVVDPDLPNGTQKQTEWAVKGVFAVLGRTVTFANRTVAKSEFASDFTAWPNRYSISPDVAREVAPEAYAEWEERKVATEAGEMLGQGTEEEE